MLQSPKQLIEYDDETSDDDQARDDGGAMEGVAQQGDDGTQDVDVVIEEDQKAQGNEYEDDMSE